MVSCLDALTTENLSQVDHTMEADNSATVTEVYKTHEENITEKIGEDVWKSLPSIQEDLALLGDKEDLCYKLIDAYIQAAFNIGYSYAAKGVN